jgi:hypothetical protein
MAKGNGKRANPDIAAEVQRIFPALVWRGHDGRRKQIFLWQLMQHGKVEAAAKAAGVGRTRSWLWRVEDDAYRQACEQAKEMAAETIEQALFVRAVDGVKRGIYHQGVKVAEEREFSDTAAIFLLKNRMPGVYKDRVSTTHEPSPGFAALVSQWQQQIDHPEVPPRRELPAAQEVIDVEHTPIKDAGVAGAPTKAQTFKMLDRLQGYESEPSDDWDEPDREFDDAGDEPDGPEPQPPRPEPPRVLDPYEAYWQARQKRS